MNTLIRTITIMCVVFFGIVVHAQAQEEKKWVSGNSFNVSFPVGDMESIYDLGLGIYGNIDYNINKVFAARFDLGWNTFSGSDIIDPITGFSEKPKMDVWEFTAGLLAKLAFVYVEARGGYFTGVKSWGVVPAVGVRLGKFDIQGNLNIAGDNQWGSARLTYYWGG